MPLERVTDGLFDYAGMFPPAELSFEDALAQSAAFPTTLHDPDIVAADMVMTPDTLPLLNPDALADVGFGGQECLVCLVGVGILDAVDQAEAVKQWNRSHADHAVPQRIISLEVHFADETAEDVQRTMDHVQRILHDDVQLFLEPKWDDGRMLAGMDAAFEVLDAINGDDQRVGIKVRCAGPTALGAKALARVIAHANQRSIPIKFTQGLHHPFAEAERTSGPLGFLNCVFGLRLHRDTDMDLAELEECLLDEDASHFTWGERIDWKGHEIAPGALSESAVSMPFTIGCCDVRDPDRELDALQD